MELFVPSFEGERKRSTRPAMRVLTAGTARAYIHDLLPPRPLSGRPVTPDTPFILLILQTILAQPLDIVLIAIPLLIQTYGIFAIAYLAAPLVAG